MNKGYLCMVLHSHLPFVRHPEHEDFLEEDWLYEAITETYIPLLNVFEGLGPIPRGTIKSLRVVECGIDARVEVLLSLAQRRGDLVAIGGTSDQ